MSSLLKQAHLILISTLTLSFVTSVAVSQEESEFSLYKNKYPNDLGVVLNHTQTVNISVNSKTKELDIFETDYEEILYLNKGVRFYTQQSISLSEFFEDIVSIEVTVISPAGKKMKLKEDAFRTIDSPPSSWVFHDDDKEVTFDLMKLDAGYRTIIEYTKKVKRPEFFDIFHFVSGYPVEIAKVQVSYPKDVAMSFYERSFNKHNVIKNELTDKKGITTKTWQLNEIPAFDDEEGSTNINHHIPHIFAQITSFQVNGETVKLIGTVAELHKFYVEFLLLKEDESNRKEINDVVRSLIADKTTDLEKIDTIYKWVQSNIKYIAFEDGINGYVPRACSAVMKNRYGDCKDMGNLLVEMLTFAEVKNAYVAWVGTNDIVTQMSEIPSPLTCNHVICVVEKEDGGYYYLDATGSEMGFILPPQSIQEKEILVHKGEGKFDLFMVPAVNAKDNYVKTHVKYSFVEGDSIRGTGFNSFSGYERGSRSYDLKNLDQEDLDEYVKDIVLRGRNRFTLKEYELKNIDHNNLPLEISYEFAVDNMLVKHGSEYFLNPVLFKPRLMQFNEENYKFDQAKDYHRTVEHLYELTVPADLKVKSFPEKVDYEHDLFTFHSAYKLEGNLLTVSMIYKFELLRIPPELFNDWNAFSDKVNEATSQNIVLEKI